MRRLAWRAPPFSRRPRSAPSSRGILNRGRPELVSSSTRETSWTENSQAVIRSRILENRTTALSDSSSAQRGAKPQAAIAKHTARKSGLYSASKGQLMKTDRRRGGLLPPGEGIGVLGDRVFHGRLQPGKRRLRRRGRRLQLHATVPALALPSGRRAGGQLGGLGDHGLNMRCVAVGFNAAASRVGRMPRRQSRQGCRRA
jgi:hypothetical protein